VPEEEIDERYIDHPYYIVPDASLRGAPAQGKLENLVGNFTTKGRSSRHCEEQSDEAIHILSLDCFAEPVIGRRLAPTRWLAMTSKTT
jgi:hypothetical protein